MTEDLKIRRGCLLSKGGSSSNVARALPRLLRPGAARPEARDIRVRNAPVSPPSAKHRKAIPTPPLTSILIHQSAVEALYRLRGFTRAKRAARPIAARCRKNKGNSLPVPYRLRRFTRAGFWCAMQVWIARGYQFSREILINCPAIRISRNLLKTIIRDHVRSTVKGVAKFAKATGLRRLARARFWCTMNLSPAQGHLFGREILINGPAIRIRRNHRKTIIGDQLRSTVEGVVKFPKATEQRRLARAVFWCAMHVSTARGHRFSHEILINGPAIRISRNLLKTIIRDHLRSTVKGGAQNHRSESKSNRTQGSP